MMFINASCPDVQGVITISANGITTTCPCCNNDVCLGNAHIQQVFCTPAAPLGGGTGGSSSASAAPKPQTQANILGPVMGQSMLNRGPFLENEGTRNDAATRWNASRSGGRSSVGSVGRANMRDFSHGRRHGTPGCFSVSRQAKLSFFQSIPPQYSAADAPASFWPPLDTPLQPIGADQSHAQSLETPGSGVHWGPPDTPPPPNPQPVNNSTECNKGWHYNVATRTCYFSEKSCDAAASGGGCGIVNRDNTLDPALGPTLGHVNQPGDCPSGSYYNTCNRSCYWGLPLCQQHIDVQNGCVCNGPKP
jgi:hypothetical protein